MRRARATTARPATANHIFVALVGTARQTTRGLPQLVRLPAPSRPAPAPGAPRPVMAARRRSGWLIYVVLYLAAAAISAITVYKGLQPNDEGLMLQAARRIAQGQLPQPHPFPIALALALGGLLLFERRPVLAGILAGVCAAWRLEFAGYLALGILLAFAIRPVAGAERVRAAGRFAVSALLTGAALFAPVVAAAGLGKSWDMLIRYPI